MKVGDEIVCIGKFLSDRAMMIKEGSDIPVEGDFYILKEFTCDGAGINVVGLSSGYENRGFTIEGFCKVNPHDFKNEITAELATKEMERVDRIEKPIEKPEPELA